MRIEYNGLNEPCRRIFSGMIRGNTVRVVPKNMWSRWFRCFAGMIHKIVRDPFSAIDSHATHMLTPVSALAKQAKFTFRHKKNHAPDEQESVVFYVTVLAGITRYQKAELFYL